MRNTIITVLISLSLLLTGSVFARDGDHRATRQRDNIQQYEIRHDQYGLRHDSRQRLNARRHHAYRSHYRWRHAAKHRIQKRRHDRYWRNHGRYDSRHGDSHDQSDRLGALVFGAAIGTVFSQQPYYVGPYGR